MNSSKYAIVISLTVHLIGFVAITWIKFGSEFTGQSKTHVSFMKVKNEIVLKRSIPVRDIVFNNPLEQKLNYEHAQSKVDNLISSNSNISVDMSSRNRTELRSIAPTSLDGLGTQKLRAKFDVQPKTIAIRDTQVNTIQPSSQFSDGFKLVDNVNDNLTRPKIELSATEQRNVLREFLNGIKKMIESKKKYPPAARNAGIEGRSGIQMIVSKDGQLVDLKIYESSGSEILDNAALESVRDALPFPPIPEEVNREKIEIKFHLVFKIT